MKTILGEKYKLIRAQNGIEVINLFASENPSLILMDLQIPELAGIEAAQIIREVSPKVPIIVMTAFTYNSDKEAAFEAGCNDFVTKPIDIESLRKIIGKYLK